MFILLNSSGVHGDNFRDSKIHGDNFRDSKIQFEK